jgi:hypothetical protein
MRPRWNDKVSESGGSNGEGTLNDEYPGNFNSDPGIIKHISFCLPLPAFATTHAVHFPNNICEDTAERTRQCRSPKEERHTPAPFMSI